MKVKHSVKLSKEQITEILVRALDLPKDTKASYTLERYGQRDEYQVFGNVELSYETELDSVTNKQGSSAPR